MVKHEKFQSLLAAVKYARIQVTRETLAKKRFTVGKLPRGIKPPRAAARDGSIAHEDAALSISRGVWHMKGCHGCDRALCRSARALVKHCAHHVRQCKLLSSQDCQACNVSSMVKAAWQSEIPDDTGETCVVK